ncbi:MAG: PAS domain S-box protein, partial [Sphingomonadaceae bacterium]
GLTLLASHLLQADMEQLLGTQQRATVALVSKQIVTSFDERFTALHQIAAELDAPMLAQAPLAQAVLQRHPLLLHAFNAGIVVLRRDGTAIADVPSIGRTGKNYLDRDYVALALQQGQANVGKPVIGKVVHVPSFAMVVPIRNAQQQVIGALLGAIDLSKPNFLDSVIDSHYGNSGGYLIIDPRHRLFVTASANNKQLIMRPLPAAGVNPVLERRLLGFDGSAVNVSSQGIEVLTSSSRIPQAGWLVIATLPTAEAFAPVRHLNHWLLGSAAGLTLLALGLTWWRLQYLLAPMQSAAQTIRAMADDASCGALLAITEADEVGALIEGFNRVLALASAREQALQHSEVILQTIIDSMAEGLVLQDVSGRILSANPAAQRILGQSTAQMQHVSSLDTRWQAVHEDGSPCPGEEHPAMQVLQNGQAVYGSIMGVCDANGARRWISINAVPLPDMQGGVVATFIDITARKQAELALQQSEQQFRTFFEKNLSVILLIRPSDGRILDANHAAARFYGYDQAALRCMRIWDLNTLSLAACSEQLTASSAERRNYFQFQHRLASGALRDVDVYATPVPIQDAVTLFSVIHDVTDRNRAIEALQRSEARYARVVEGTDEGFWEWQLASGQISVSPRFEAMLGYAPGSWICSRENWLAQVHPDDVGPALQRFEQHLRGEAPVYLCEFRMRHQSGAWCWIQSKGKVAERAADGSALLVSGTHMDITARKIAELALQDMNQDFVTLLESSSDFVYFKDQHSRFRYCSQTLATITGHRSWKDMIGKHDTEVFPPDIARIYGEEEQPIFAEGKPLLNQIDPYFMADGTPGWVSTNKWPMFGADGQTVVGIFGISRDVTALKRQEDELRRMATTDFLTGVASRRHFIDALEQELLRLQRNVAGACTLLMFDLDHFKRVNDSHGHAAGDAVLRQVTRLMAAEVRKVDLLGRLGGEEFAILLPDTTPQAALVFAERLRQLVELASIPVDVQHIRVTVSIGVAALCATDTSSATPLARADLALYAAKHEGRNQVRLG